MARRLLKDTCELAAEILNGDHDEILDHIEQAAAARRKNLFRVGQVVRFVNVRGPASLEGREGTIFGKNPKTFKVGLGSFVTDEFGGYWTEGEFNVPASMLQAV